MATPSPRDDYQATLRAVSRVDVQNLGRAGATCCQILGVLARYTRAGSPLCWLGTEAMALELRRNGSTVKRAMALLDKHGHISRYQVKGLGRMFAVHPSGRWATRPSANAIVDHLASWQNASGFRNRRLPAGGNDLRASVARWAVGLDPAASMAARTGGVTPRVTDRTGGVTPIELGASCTGTGGVTRPDIEMMKIETSRALATLPLQESNLPSATPAQIERERAIMALGKRGSASAIEAQGKAVAVGR
jgi:hypothetical protein